jgi:hypothetical protein
LQHYLWKQRQGFLVHPSIPIHTGSLKIADIGTGTGIWLLDLASTIPSSTQLHGFDVDLSQCPPKEWLPSNVSMQLLNIYEEVPEELQEQYGMPPSLLIPYEHQYSLSRHDKCSVLSLRCEG